MLCTDKQTTEKKSCFCRWWWRWGWGVVEVGLGSDGGEGLQNVLLSGVDVTGW